MICKSQEDIFRLNLRFFIVGGEIRKVSDDAYIGMTLTSRGFSQTDNIKRDNAALSSIIVTAITSRLRTDLASNSTNRVLETYLRSRYLYNSTVLNYVDILKEVDV